MSLYDAIGVPKDASEDEIRKAYKRRASELHPDRQNGDTGKFMQLSKAYRVLMDKDRRRHYDQTGDDEEGDVFAKRARSEIYHLVKAAVDHVDVEREDVLELVHASIDAGLIDISKKISSSNARIKKLESVLRRLKLKRGEEDFLALGLREEISEERERIGQCEFDRKVADAMRKILDGYTYERDITSSWDRTLPGSTVL